MVDTVRANAPIEVAPDFSSVVRRAFKRGELDLLVETWDFAEGCIVALPEGRDNRIDQGHRADHGALSIRMAHIQKAVEAQLILAGIDLPLSLVAAEAAATDVAIKDLAAAIVERQAQTNTIELARRIAKKSD